MAVLYPWPAFYDVPVGVPVDSYWADAVTLLVTAVELGVVYLVVRYDVHVAAVEAVRSLAV